MTPPGQSPIALSRGRTGRGPEPVIDRFIAASAVDPFGTWCILPTRRLARDTIRKIRDRDVPVIPSRIGTIDDICATYFEENRTTPRFLLEPESKILLSQIISDHKKELPLFFSRGHPSTGTVENFRDFISVITRRKIAYPEILGDLQGEKSRQIAIVVKAYRDYLDAHDLVDSDMILSRVARHLSGSPDHHPFGQVFIHGLCEPLPLEQDLIKAIASASESCMAIVPDDPNSRPYRNRTGKTWFEESGLPVSIVVEEGTGRPLAGLFAQANGPIETTETIRTATFPTRYAEVAGIAEEICRLHENGVPFSDMAVTFPEARETMALVREIFSDYALPWTTTTGTHISHVPVVGFLVQIPEIPAGQFSREDVVRVIASPYFRNRKRTPVAGAPGSGAEDIQTPAINPDPDPGDVDLVSRVAQIEKGFDTWPKGLDRLLARIAVQAGDEESPLIPVSRETVERVQRWLLPLLSDLEKLNGKKSLSSHRKDYRDFLSRWGLDVLPDFPDENIRDEESAASETFFRCLDRLDGMAGILGDREIDASKFHEILSTLVKETEIYLDGDRTGVTLLGLRECVHQQIPYLFIAGLSEGDMPRLTTRIPFTNTLENARMGTRSLAEILDEI